MGDIIVVDVHILCVVRENERECVSGTNGGGDGDDMEGYNTLPPK